MEPRRTDESRIGLGRAVLYSVVAHVVILLLLSFVWPEAEPARSSEPDDVEVTFDLSPEDTAAMPEPVTEEIPEAVPEEETAEETIPETDLFKPFVEEDQANSDVPTNPRPSALGVPEPVSDTPDPEPVDEPPVPEVVDAPVTDERPEPEPIEDVLEQSEPQPVAPEDDVSDDAQRPDSEQEAPDGAALPSEQGQIPEPTQDSGERRLDVDRAIRDLFSSPPKARETRPEQGDQGSRGGMEMPDLDQLPSSGFGLDRNLFFESRDYDWTDYSRAIYMAIWRAWHNRLWQTTNQFERWAYSERSWMLEHHVLIRWTIHRNGRISDIAIVTASGCIPLDDSAVNAMEEVVIQPLPSDFPRDRETVHGRFIAVGDIRDIKRTLDLYKRAGWF